MLYFILEWWLQDWLESSSICNHTRDLQNRTTAKQESDFVITCMFTNRIGWHNVLLPINQINYKGLFTKHRPIASMAPTMLYYSCGA